MFTQPKFLTALQASFSATTVIIRQVTSQFSPASFMKTAHGLTLTLNHTVNSIELKNFKVLSIFRVDFFRLFTIKSVCRYTQFEYADKDIIITLNSGTIVKTIYGVIL